MYVFSKIVSNYLIITGTVCIRAIILKILCTCICNKKYTQYELPELLLSGERRGEEGGGGGGGEKGREGERREREGGEEEGMRKLVKQCAVIDNVSHHSNKVIEQQHKILQHLQNTNHLLSYDI